METDEALYQRVKQRGDMRAFDMLYERYERRLFGFILRYLPVRADAEEVLHDTFLRILRSREVRFDRGSFGAWLYKIAKNLCLNRLRSTGRAEAKVEAAPEPQPPPSAEDLYVAREAEEAVVRAVAELPVSLAEVYHLRAAGMSYEEISFALELPLGTVKSRIHEMIVRLKTGVAQWLKQ